MASFKAKFPVLQELFAKNHRGGPFPAGRVLKGRKKIVKPSSDIAGALVILADYTKNGTC